MLRTHHCGQLNRKHVGESVTLAGWVHAIRDHGGIVFVHLRDRYGITQVISNPEDTHYSVMKKLNREDCIQVTGQIQLRGEKDFNKQLSTGEIEVICKEAVVLNESLTPPFEIDDAKVANDDLRLKYRYLDLRRPKMQKNLMLRNQAMQSIRQSLLGENFLEIETPLFVRSTPEGARDFVVPSRLHPNKFFALPQSPQLYKQLLMVSGFDKYFQFAHCFRDEDLRADRALVFTQVDLEMTFVEEKDVFGVVERFVTKMLKDTIGKEVSAPFKIISYGEAIEHYGVDKPDLRFGLKLKDITTEAQKSSLDVFQSAKLVKTMVLGKDLNLSRKDVEAFGDYTKNYGLKGFFYTKISEAGFDTGVAKFFEPTAAQSISKKIEGSVGDFVIIAAGDADVVNTSLGSLRNHLGRKLNLVKPDDFCFVWVNDFPLFEWDKDAKKWNPMHHLFTKPKAECMQYLDTDPGKVLGNLYDLVLNGVEILSGSIRINRPDLQQKIFEIIQMPLEEAQSKFGFLLEAFKYGAPPHGGCAIGFDRLSAILAGEDSIREVIAFPNNASGVYPIDGSPSYVHDVQLNELKLILKK